MSAGKPPFWMKLKAQAGADPRKAIVLLVLGVIMVVMYMRMFSAGPSRGAEAETLTTIAEDTPSNEVSHAQAGKPAQIGAMKRIEISEPLVRELTHDPFGGDTHIANQLPAEPSSGSHRIEPIAGPVTSSDRQSDKPKELELQSTICCDDPIAGINGRFVRAGEWIGEYLVERIGPTQVWLRKGDARLVLSLKGP